MEKSFWKAATTKTNAARKTTAKAATPARRAVSPRRADEASFSRTSAASPARKEYAHSARARSSAKLPICDMGSSRVFFQKPGSEATGEPRDPAKQPAAAGILAAVSEAAKTPRRRRVYIRAARVQVPQGNLRALLLIVTGPNFALGPQPVLIFIARGAAPFFVQFVGPFPDLYFQINGSGIARSAILANLGNGSGLRHGDDLFVG